MQPDYFRRISSSILVLTIMLGTAFLFSPYRAQAATHGITSAGTTTYSGGGMTETATRVGSGSEQSYPTSFIDAANGFVYYGSDTSPTVITKYNMSDLSVAGSLTLEAGERWPYSSVVHDGFAYVGTWDGMVVKINLTTFTRVGTITIPSSTLIGAAVDSSAGFAYFVTNDDPVVIHKVNLTTFTLTGSLTLSAGEDQSWANPVVDVAGGSLYVGTYSSSTVSKIVKVSLASFTRTSAVSLNAGEKNVYALAHDSTNGFIYAVTLQDPIKVIKVQKSDMTRVGSLTLTGKANGQKNGSVVDPTGTFLYVVNGGASNKGISKIDLGTFTSVGSQTLSEVATYYDANVFDISNGFGYFGSYNNPARVSKVALSQKGSIKATKLVLSSTTAPTSVSFYSHAASGNVRLGIYDSSKNLIWESGSTANTAASDWLTVNISAGTPTTLSMPAGTYWLAYQTDTMKDVPSYTAGSSGDGFYITQNYGAFDASVTGETSTAETWSMYLTSASGGRLSGPAAPLMKPVGDYKMFINGDQPSSISSANVDISFNDRGDIHSLDLSTDPQMKYRNYFYYKAKTSYDICRGWRILHNEWRNNCPAGEYTVYARLYGHAGQESEVISLTVNYNPEADILSRILKEAEEAALELQKALMSGFTRVR